MNYKSEVLAYGETRWTGNQLVFATREEAQAYVEDLFSRWTLVDKYRVVETDAPVNYKWVDGKAIRLE